MSFIRLFNTKVYILDIEIYCGTHVCLISSLLGIHKCVNRVTVVRRFMYLTHQCARVPSEIVWIYNTFDDKSVIANDCSK